MGGGGGGGGGHCDDCTPPPYTPWPAASQVALFCCMQDIYLHDPRVRWDDIIGLDAAKRLVKEAVVYPIKVSGWEVCLVPSSHIGEMKGKRG